MLLVRQRVARLAGSLASRRSSLVSRRYSATALLRRRATIDSDAPKAFYCVGANVAMQIDKFGPMTPGRDRMHRGGHG